MNWFALTIGGLVTFRLALLISKESGPAFIFRKLRGLPPAKSSAKEGLSCEWCMSIWFAALVALYEYFMTWITIKELPLYWLAFSSLAIFANQQWTKH
jgi:hypothetical protein